MGYEIERKWLVKGFPQNVTPDEVYVIGQNYLSSGENECRIREAFAAPGFPKNMSMFKMTLKGPGEAVRRETEIELRSDQFSELAGFCDGKKPIVKMYHKYHVDGRTVEISRVDDEWYYAEVEFQKYDKDFVTYEFPWPEIVEKEVTYDDSYKMKNYWNRTRGGM